MTSGTIQNLEVRLWMRQTETGTYMRECTRAHTHTHARTHETPYTSESILFAL